MTYCFLQVELLKLWFAHMREVKPGIYVTYNGDYFDWPFLESRAAYHGFKMSDVSSLFLLHPLGTLSPTL